MKMSRVGILLESKSAERRWKYGLNVFESYIGEVLSHLCIPHEWIDDISTIVVSKPDMIIVALYEENEQTDALLLRFAEQGGTLISYAGLNHLAAKLGFREIKSISNGYAQLPGSDGKDHHLRFKHARPWIRSHSTTPDTCDKIGAILKEHQNGDNAGEAVIRINHGKGKIERWSVDILRTIVELQQGSGPVVEDGVPAIDGSGETNEGILKADDRCEMDWEYDRERTATGAPYYAQPYADLWREELVRQLLRCSFELGQTLPFADYWPDGVSTVATISHDSDINVDEHAESTLELLQECKIHTTWCMIEPGYSPEIYEKVLEQGHELGLHYNALEEDQGSWGENEFDNQCKWFKQATGLDSIKTNKNHYTCFEGWGELFSWCEKNGIQADQTRGPSKRGNIGFLFGTCHAFYPISSYMEKNRLYDVLEVGFLTQDIDHPELTDSSVIEPFLEQVSRVGGIAHFLFHQIHIHNYEAVRNALRQVVHKARERGFIFWTCQQINDWERARRSVAIHGIDEKGFPLFSKADSLTSLVVYIPLQDEAYDTTEIIEERFGVRCKRIVIK